MSDPLTEYAAAHKRLRPTTCFCGEPIAAYVVVVLRRKETGGGSAHVVSGTSSFCGAHAIAAYEEMLTAVQEFRG